MIYKKFSKKTNRLFAILTLALALLIFVKSLSVAMPSLHIHNSDKIIHAIAYFVLGVFALPAFTRVKPIWVFVLTSGFGVLIEILQGLMHTGRTADPMDALANAVGVGLAVVFWWFVSRIF